MDRFQILIIIIEHIIETKSTSSIYKKHYDESIEAHEGEAEEFDPRKHYTHKKHKNKVFSVDGEEMTVLSVNPVKRLVVFVNSDHQAIEKPFKGTKRNN